MAKTYKSITIDQCKIARGKSFNQPSCDNAIDEFDKMKENKKNPQIFRDGSRFFVLDATPTGSDFQEYLDTSADSEPCDLYG